MITVGEIRVAVPSALRASLRRGMTDLPAVFLHTSLMYNNNSNNTIYHYHYDNNHTTTNSNSSSHTNSTTSTINISRSSSLLAFLVVLGTSFVALPIILLLCRNFNDRQHRILLTRTTATTSTTTQNATSVTSTTTSHNRHLPHFSSTPSQPHRQQQERHVNTHLAMELSSMGPDRQKVEYKLVTSRFSRKHDNNDDSHHHSGKNDTRHKEGCTICLGSFHLGEEVAQSVNQECCHLFHTECIVDWLVIHPHCPQCRRDFFLVSNNNNSNNDNDPTTARIA